MPHVTGIAGIILSSGLMACCLALAGCGGVRAVPVSGTVTVDGKPVEHVGVNFAPLETSGAARPGSSGVTDAEGRFTLQTVGKRRVGGAVPGKHRVTLFEGGAPGAYDPYADSTLTPEELEAKLRQIRFKLPPEARDGSLTFEVPPGGASEANFQFNSAATPK
jgi:hypothetical protein